MKTNFWPHPSLRSLTLLSVLIALVVSAFSVSGVSAARTVPIAELESTWDRQLDRLFVHGIFFDNVRLYPADFEDLDDLEQAYLYLDKFRIALRGAQTLVATHPGFDFEGNVTNQLEATRTVQAMANYLWVMRGMRNKLAEMDAVR